MNRLEVIHKIGSKFNSEKYWKKKNLINFSKYLEDSDNEVKMATFKYFCKFVLEKMNLFNEIFLNLKFQEMNLRLECLGIYCYVRTNIYKYTRNNTNIESYYNKSSNN